jgi:hypothetical protein
MKPKINQPTDGRCGYIAVYGNKQAEVWADSAFQASERAKAFFNPPKSKAHLVSVHVAEVDGQQVTTPTDF